MVSITIYIWLLRTRNVLLGMDVVVVRGIQGGFNSKMELVKKNVYRQGVRFLRTGVESDQLISAISDLYGSDESPRRMVDEETFTAIALHQGSLDMDSEPVKLKISGRTANLSMKVRTMNRFSTWTFPMDSSFGMKRTLISARRLFRRCRPIEPKKLVRARKWTGGWPGCTTKMTLGLPTPR